MTWWVFHRDKRRWSWTVPAMLDRLTATAAISRLVLATSATRETKNPLASPMSAAGHRTTAG
jgi:hypothetical protein